MGDTKAVNVHITRKGNSNLRANPLLQNHMHVKPLNHRVDLKNVSIVAERVTCKRTVVKANNKRKPKFTNTPVRVPKAPFIMHPHLPNPFLFQTLNKIG